MKRPLPIWPLGQMRFAIGLNVLRTLRYCHDFFSRVGRTLHLAISLIFLPRVLSFAF